MPQEPTTTPAPAESIHIVALGDAPSSLKVDGPGFDYMCDEYVDYKQEGQLCRMFFDGYDKPADDDAAVRKAYFAKKAKQKIINEKVRIMRKVGRETGVYNLL
jgi:hypothetical protein